jgi:hypothetical protein
VFNRGGKEKKDPFIYQRSIMKSLMKGDTHGKNNYRKRDGSQ